MPSTAEGFDRVLSALRREHVERASTALDYEVVKLFRNPISPGNCFHDFLLRQAAAQGAERLAFLTQARQTLDADSYRLRFQGTWRAMTSDGCPPDARTPVWRRYLASRGIEARDPQKVMGFIEKTASAYDAQYRDEQDNLARQADPNRLGFRGGSGLFVTSIFDTAFRLDRLVAHIRRARAEPFQRVLVAGPGLNIVDQFLGTQVPVSSPQPVCLLESLLSHRLAHERTRVDLVDLSPEVMAHWTLASRGVADYPILAYLLAGAPHGEAGRLTRAYLENFGRRLPSSEAEWFVNREPRRGVLWADPSGRFLPAPAGLHVREFIARAAVLKRFAPSLGDIVTDRIAAEGTYDLAVATNLLLYFEPREAALAVFNLGRLLNPGGYLFVTEDLDPVLPSGHPLQRVWIDEMKDAAPPGVTLPALYVYRKQASARAQPDSAAR
ncbi:MAG: class I SAM-dependent methyltransferase [Bryobacteraceae bacterium]